MFSCGLKVSLFILALAYLTGCTSVIQPVDESNSGIDGIACVGDINKTPEGLVEIDDRELLKKSLDSSGNGKLCKAKIFLTTKPVTVYRVWNSDKSYTIYGSWWSFDLPRGPKHKYREDNGICPSWSSLNRMSSCNIKVGNAIAIGTGQSAKCKEMTYAKSAINQVFIPNDSRNNIILVENCIAGVN